MQGRKDVVLLSPQGGTATLITKYEDFNDPIMPYMYHCHILSHEDNGMMGQFIIGPSTAGINDFLSTDNTVFVYPNPVNNLLTIQMDTTSEKFVTEIVNILGEKILETNTNLIDVSSFSNGIYFIYVYKGDKILKAKFVKQ